ncbi:MAG: hypothetical protein WC783_03915 [Candidatus Paceibacterota bacterium]|jgi:hypothetical protein
MKKKEYVDYIIDSVERSTDKKGYIVGHSGAWCIYVEDVGVVPEVGDILRGYGKGIGYTVKSIDIIKNNIAIRVR